MSVNKMILSEMAGGGLQELFEHELDRIVENINDPNTEVKAARKLVIELKFKPIDDSRDLVGVEITPKTSLAPTVGTKTKMIIGSDGKVLVAAEYHNQIPGQMAIDEETGEILEDNAFKQNIVNFKAE
jgi:hypothetical protein